MTYPELCEAVERALDGRASYNVQIGTQGIRDVEAKSKAYTHKRKWLVSIGPYWQSVEGSTPEAVYRAFEAALLPLLDSVPPDGADVGV